MFIMNLGSHERGVHFRLGRVVRVVGPGLVIVLPVVDRIHIVDLNALFPGWRGLGKEEIERRVMDHVLYTPGTKDDVSAETARPVRPGGSSAREREEAASAQKKRIMVRLFVFLLGLCVAATGGVMLAGEFQALIEGRAEPLRRTFVTAPALTFVGEVVSLQVLVGPLFKRLMVKRQLEDMKSMLNGTERK